MRYLFPFLCALLLHAPTFADADWQARNSDDGALFYGNLLSDPPGITLTCVGRSRGMVPLVQAGAHEIEQTPPLTLRLELSPALVPDPGDGPGVVGISLWVDGRGFGIPAATWNELDGVWTANIAMADPLVGLMRNARDIVIGQNAGPHYRYPTAGIGPALQQVLQFCSNEYARLGHPLPPALTEFGTPPPQRPNALEAAMLRAIAQTCEAGAQIDPDYPMRGDVDGDGIDDLLLDWRAVTCSNETMQFHCGASQCGIDLFLSSQYPVPGKPQSMLGLGGSLIELSNGRQGVSVGGSLYACQEAGKGPNGCEFIWYWAGRSLERIP